MLRKTAACAIAFSLGLAAAFVFAGAPAKTLTYELGGMMLDEETGKQAQFQATVANDFHFLLDEVRHHFPHNARLRITIELADDQGKPHDPQRDFPNYWKRRDEERRLRPPYIPRDEWIDERDIPNVGDTKTLGASYPRIIVDNERLEYWPDKQRYFYAGTGQSAMWFTIPQKDNRIPERMLSIPIRSITNGKIEEFRGGKWIASQRKAVQLPRTGVD